MALKKIFLAFLLVTFCTAASAAPLSLVKRGQANATIVVQSNAPAPIQQAATDLQLYLQKISGVQLPLKTDGKDVPGITLNVGKTESALAADFPDAKLNPETYAITQRNDDVYFEGNYPSPVAFAVYSFLQDQLGVRWFAPGEDWEYVPQHRDKSTFTIDVQNVVSIPDTSPRIWSGHQWTQAWNDWNLRNKAVQSEKVPRRNFQNYMFHVFPPSKYAKTHPEYYPLINGKRWISSSDSSRSWWPCIGNPDVQRLTAEYIHRWFKAHPDQDSFSLGMDDIAYICEDPLCRAMDAHQNDAQERNFSSRYYKFVNIVAKEVKKTDPDKYIGVLIYNIVRKPPVDVAKLEDNVFGYIANGSVAQWYQPGKKQEWMDNTKEWSKRVKRLSRYDYFGLGTFTPRVFPHAMAEEIKIDHSLGFEGMYGEIYTFLPQTAPMIWALAQLQWDANQDIDVLLDDFYQKMFGEAAPTVKKYFSVMEDSWMEDRPGRKGWVWRSLKQKAISISPQAAAQGETLLLEALQQTRDSLEKKRINMILSGLRYAKFAIDENDLASKIAKTPLKNNQDALAMQQQIMQFGQLIQQRQKFWGDATRSDDLFGASIKNTPLLHNNISALELPIIHDMIRLSHWLKTNQESSAKNMQEMLNAFPPENEVRVAMQAWSALQDSGATTLLRNGEFENLKANAAAPAGSDWVTQGTPVGWNLWSRYNAGGVQYVQGRASKHAIQIASSINESPLQNTVAQLLQNEPAKPGEKYLAVAWVKLLRPEDAAKVNLRVRTRKGTSGGGDVGPGSKIVAAETTEWQPLIVSVTVPETATFMTVVLSVSDGEAIFDDVALYKIP